MASRSSRGSLPGNGPNEFKGLSSDDSSSIAVTLLEPSVSWPWPPRRCGGMSSVGEMLLDPPKAPAVLARFGAGSCASPWLQGRFDREGGLRGWLMLARCPRVGLMCLCGVGCGGNQSGFWKDVLWCQ
jgi:hypothetical protein